MNEVTLVGIESGLLNFNRYIKVADNQNREVAIVAIEQHFDCILISISSFGRLLEKVIIENWQKPTSENIWKQVNILLNKNGLIVNSEKAL